MTLSSTTLPIPTPFHVSLFRTFLGYNFCLNILISLVNDYYPGTSVSRYSFGFLSSSLSPHNDDIVVVDMEDDMAADMEVYVVADMEVDKVAENMAVMTVDMFKTKCIKPEMF